MSRTYTVTMITIAGIAWTALYFTPPAPTVTELVEARVVVVETSPGGGTSGTGFLIAPDIVLTAGHVAVKLRKGSQVYNFAGKVAKVDSIWIGDYTATSGTDIGLLYLETPMPGIPERPVATRCKADQLQYLDPLVAVGAQTHFGGFMALPMPVAMPYVDLLEADFNKDGKADIIFENYITVSASTVFGGLSGSAVVDEYGRLVGVVIRKSVVPVAANDTHSAGLAHVTAGPIVCDVIANAATYERTPVDAAE